MASTEISWTDKVWNVTRGCRRVSAGCGGAKGEGGCYAERQAYRFSGPGQPYEGLVKLTANGPRWTGAGHFAADKLAEPLSWGKPQRVFVDSMSDLFFEVFSNEQIAAVFGVMAACQHLTFQVLTKRPKRMREWFAWLCSKAGCEAANLALVLDAAAKVFAENGIKVPRETRPHDRQATWPLRSVWLGVSVENQAAADERIPDLLATPAAVRFLSCEPLLGEVSLGMPRTWLVGATARKILRDHGAAGTVPEHLRPPTSLDWVITGCESGPGARPCDVEWLRSLRDQCAAAGVAFFLKQAREVDGQMTAVPGPTPLEDQPGYSPRVGPFIPTIGCGGGSKRKRGDVIELPYLDGVQQAAFPTTKASR